MPEPHRAEMEDGRTNETTADRGDFAVCVGHGNIYIRFGTYLVPTTYSTKLHFTVELESCEHCRGIRAARGSLCAKRTLARLAHSGKHPSTLVFASAIWHGNRTNQRYPHHTAHTVPIPTYPSHTIWRDNDYRSKLDSAVVLSSLAVCVCVCELRAKLYWLAVCQHFFSFFFLVFAGTHKLQYRRAQK